MAALLIDVLWQVASRYLLQDPSSWTDELATLLIIWVAMLGSSIAFARHHHLGVDYFVEKLAPSARRITEMAVQAMVGLFAVVVLILGGSKLVALTLLTEQVSPALGVKMGHVYLALPISGLLILLVAMETMVGQFQAPEASRREDKA